MFRRNQTIYLPLLLSGVPMAAVAWLHAAGVPVAPFQTTPALSRRGQNAAGQVLIFDARSATGRLDARTARECGAETINVSDLVPRELSQPMLGADAVDVEAAGRRQVVRAAFLDELKQRIEAAGGFWLRLGDYPYPYRSAACSSVDPARDRQAFAETFALANVPALFTGQPRSGSGGASVVEIEQSYASGRPVFANAFPPSDLSTGGGIEGDRFPLMWRTSGDELLRWSRIRSKLELIAWRTGTTYRIQHSGKRGRFQPAIELWLGCHVASFPLAGEAMTVREEGIVFVQEQRRHPGGMAAAWPVDFGLSQQEEAFVHQPV